MKYDIEFVIPATSQGKYFDRIEFFKQIGLLNIGKCKVSVKILLGTHNIPGLKEGWPEGVDVHVVLGKRNQIGAKIAEYYSQLEPKDINARWSAKFDDDSVNDVSGLVENLDTQFDSNLPYYICTELRREVHPADRASAEFAGFGFWFNDPNKSPIHEKEGSVISGYALKRITETPKAMDILRKRSSIEDGWGDIALAYAARAAKVYPSECQFLSKDPLVDNFSTLGGSINHIHYIAPDINPIAADFLLGSLLPPKWIVGKEYLFGKINKKGKVQSIAVFTFHPNGQITPKMPNEKLWFWNGKEIVLLDHTANPTSMFTPNEDKSMMTGKFLPEPETKHILYRIDVPNTRP